MCESVTDFFEREGRLSPRGGAPRRIMPTMADTDVDGIVAFLKKSDAKGHSVYEQLASVVQ